MMDVDTTAVIGSNWRVTVPKANSKVVNKNFDVFIGMKSGEIYKMTS